ncbi:hypothetical protein BJ878DRAFT_541278 [Calycina marina]|uniref:Uncharacterized protein n=1 Tax=Calycina marina TaxID=1763456 RepID=A0A9P7Z4J5_9HELO|nr:hypothetical protein BJ878DRAFT_541278 [Calycina marina]
MSTEQAKGCWKGLNPDEQIEAALRDGLSEDTSGIDRNTVHRKLNEKTSQPRYDAMLDFWEAYERKYPRSDLRNMEDMKHITEAVGRSTPGRLDKELKRATVKTVRNKMRKLMSIWQRNTNLTIPPEVHDSVAPYIKDVLRYKIPLSIEEKAPTFLTIEKFGMRDFVMVVGLECDPILAETPVQLGSNAS